MQLHRSRISALRILLAILLGAVWGRGAEPDASVAEALAWVDTLGLPAVKDCPFVRVSTGSWTKTGNQPPRNRFCYGFLTKDEGAEFRVYVRGIPGDEDAFPHSTEGCWPLAVMTYIKKPAAPEHERVGYEVLDLKKEATALRKKLRRPRPDSLPRCYYERESMDERVAVFLFARDCLKSGLTEIANDLMEQAEAMPDSHEPRKSLRAALELEIGRMRMAKAEADLSDPKISRRESLADFEEIAKLFPACGEAKRARENAELLRQMLAEDEAHHPPPFEKMTTREKVAEWIFQLRDQTGQRCSPGFAYYLDADWQQNDGRDTPARQLVKLGYAAVPQLIDALGDPRFSRAVFVMSWHRLSYDPLRVGDCAHDILERIAGRSFEFGRAELAEPARAGEIAAAKKEVGVWWKDLRKKGAKTLMIEAVRRGGSDSPEQADQLMKTNPADALAAIIAGAHAAKDSSTRSYLVAAASRVPGDAPVQFLRTEMKDASRAIRVCAAIALFRRGQPGVVPAMIEDWERLRPNLRTNQNDEYHDAGDLIGFLAACGKPEAVKALGRDFRDEPIEVRLAIVRAFASPSHGMSYGASGQSISRSSGPLDPPEPPKIDPAAESLLVAALDDTEARQGMAGDWMGVDFFDPRICDMAAFVLAKRWPEKYAFRWNASREDRDIQLVVAKNVWRAAQGRPPLPVPVRSDIAPAPEAEIAPLLERLIAAPDAAQRDAAAVTIEKTVGLRALPALRSRLAQLANEHPANAALRALAKRLASQVRVVQPGTATLGADFKQQLDALRGESLDAGLLERVLILLAGKLPPKTKGFTFIAERAEPDSGFVISIEWIPGLPQDSKVGWSSFERVHFAEKDLYNSASWNAEGRDAASERYSDMRKALTKALAADSDAPISVHFQAVRQRNN